METQRICPNCHKPLPPDVPLGLCPECLVKAGFPTGTEPGAPAESAARFVPPTPEELTPLFPQLEILAFIGQGGMGAVYRARQKQLDRMVALKILPPDVGSSPLFAERFTREARALAKLNHPGIVTLYEFGTATSPLPALSPSDGERVAEGRERGASGSQPSTLNSQLLYYFLMEFVDGVNLGQLLRAGKLAPKEALAIVPQICDALQYAHDRGIVHRDIKPENILLGKEGQVKVADFGVAKIVGPERGCPSRSSNESLETLEEPGASSAGGLAAAGTAALRDLTDAGKVLGTPQYMAPEQKERPLEVDHRADIYSLGVVLYQMLTGELPAGKFEPPSRKVQVDVRIDEIVLRALEKNPELRYQQASVFKTQVETISAEAGKSEIRNPKSEPQPQPALTRSWMGFPFVEERNGEPAVLWAGVAIAWVVCWGVLSLSIPLLWAGAGDEFEKFISLPACLGLGQLLAAAFIVVGIVWCRRSVRSEIRKRGGGFKPPEETIAATPAGSSRGDEAQTEKRKAETTSQSLVTSAATNHEPRFSRTALFGVCWLPFFFAAALLLMPHSVVVESGQPQPGPSWWRFLLMVMLLPLGLTAPFATTILGWIAVSQIRRSAGKLHGLWLAVFDGLLFPLLILDAVVVKVLVGFARIFAEFYSNFSNLNNPQVHPPFATQLANLFSQHDEIAPLIAALIVIVVDFLIIRRVWRAVNQPATPSCSSRRLEAQTEESEIGNQKSEMPLRFSRPAIVGAVWIGLFFLNWLAQYTPPGWALTHFFRNSPLRVVSELLVFVPLMLLGFAAVVGGSVMGVVALCQIRQARGAVRGFGLALFEVLFFPLLLANAWAAWLTWKVFSQIMSAGSSGAEVSGMPAVLIAVLVLFGLVLNALLIRTAAITARQFVNSPPLPVRPPVTGAWSQVFKAALLRLVLVVIVQLALFETLEQVSGHWKESTQELWGIALAVATLGGLAWACWPGYRLRQSWLFWAGGVVVSSLLLLGLDNLYAWHLRPNLGLYRESDWVAQHPGFQKQLRSSVEKNLWRKSVAIPASDVEAQTAFIARLPVGALELVAVSYHPLTNSATSRTWWRPDGTAWPMQDAGFETSGQGMDQNAGERARTFVLRGLNLPEGASWPALNIEQASVWSGGEVWVAGGEQGGALKLLTVLPYSPTNRINLKIGVACTPWKTVAAGIPNAPSSQPVRDLTNGVVSFLPGSEVEGQATVSVTHELFDYDVRLVAVDAAGKPHVETLQSTTSEKSLLRTTAQFAGLPRSKVKEFRLQMRGFDWVEFRNVSLEPGLSTVVEVVHAPAGAKADAKSATGQRSEDSPAVRK